MNRLNRRVEAIEAATPNLAPTTWSTIIVDGEPEELVIARHFPDGVPEGHNLIIRRIVDPKRVSS